MLGGEDLSRYSNKIESVGLRKCPCYHYLTVKMMPHRGGKTTGMKKITSLLSVKY